MKKDEIIDELVALGVGTEEELNEKYKSELEEMLYEAVNTGEDDILDEEEKVTEEIVEEEVANEEKIDISKLSKAQMRQYLRIGKI